MVRHVVLFELAKEAEGKNALENAEIIKESLLALQDTIDVIQRMEVGINNKDADDTNFTLCLIVDFETFEDLNTYVVHPEHKKVGAYIVKVKTGRACVDYII
ncbi:stress responsive alpha/beta barrel protein [Mobilisporobacter senegalensis]|uniref:Stress responsive alpha/beta barrel protein n=1 Tax=Mobilisporobacter senegalensis TaxID=1329262 RepID=A0A3N1XPJ8_9FIRM|nr:Dabb family protein [Mobilisporobacter senegalensis]ROR28575.1 stress responsive alpha/beta barrel protein [Mobilisporobacter senegalensis]